MKSAEAKTASAQPAQTQEQAQQPFFQKNGQGGFFSEETKPATPFFSPQTIQPKLRIGKPNDAYEQEADAMAEKVVGQISEGKTQTAGKAESATNQSNSQTTSSVQTAANPAAPELQEKAGEEEGLETENNIQRKAIFESNEDAPDADVQTKLTGAPAVQAKCDHCAQEEEVQKKEEEGTEESPDLQMQPVFEGNAEPPEDSGASQNTEPADIQRMCAECAEEEENNRAKQEPEIQTQADAAPTPAATPDLQSRLNNTKGGGKPLPEDTRSSMESGFGADFSGVRVHNDQDAAQMNKDLGAHAFTHGSDIYFNEGKYDTGSMEGQKLLAHELTHTVQQGGSPTAVQKTEAPSAGTSPSAPIRPTAPIEIGQRFEPDQAWAAYLDTQRGNVEVPVTIGGEYQGNITVRKDTRRSTEGRPARFLLGNNRRIHYLDVNGMEFLSPLRSAGVYPVLVLRAFGEEGQTTGFLSIRRGDVAVGDVLGLIDGFNEKMQEMRFLGLDRFQVPRPGVENRFENGRLVFQVTQLSTVIDGYLRAGGGFGIVGTAFTFNLNANVDVAGLASGEFTLAREESGALNGRATIQASIANVDASIVVEYLDGVVTIQGTGQIQSEKFTGSITLLVTERNRARSMMHAALGVQALDQEAENPERPPAPKTPQNQVLVGWGEVTARITPWLEGTAKVGIDAQGQVTVVGEIVVPGEVELMEMRGKKVDLFNLEIRAGYGIPVIGQVFLFASVGMFINAGFGPLVLRDIRFEGTYSTDPAILQQFMITGTLSLNAFAVLGLEAEAGVGLTLLGHDVKAGVNVTAAAGLRAYALATPTFEYAERPAEGGKVGEAHLRGHFEAAAQLFLQLSGALFVELDCPWWSPLDDGREEFPLGEVQYPIGDSLGIGGDIDWLVGSPDVPEIEFSPVEFDANQFTADVMADPPPGRQGDNEAAPEGEWQDGTTPGNLNGDPAVQEGGEGTPHGPAHEENLRNLPDEQRYMRGLSEISDIAESRERQTKRVVETKINRIKGKYNLDEVRIREENDDNVQIYVHHAQQNNGHHLVVVPIMSEAERLRLLEEAMQDLTTRMNQQAGEAGTLAQADARSVAEAWHGAHPIIESVRVVDGRDSWDFQVDIGDRNQVVPGKGKAEATEVHNEPGSDTNENLPPEEKERRVQEGLNAIDVAEQAYLENEAITKEHAEEVAVSVKIRFPIFTSLTVVDGGDTWDYDYTASPGKKKKGPQQKIELKMGRIAMNASNKESALSQLEIITVGDVGNEIDQKTLERYKNGVPNRRSPGNFIDGYKQYLERSNATHEWPLQYLRNRAARKRGRSNELKFIEAVYTSGVKNTQDYTTTVQTGSENRRITVIPDFVLASENVVGDVKDVADISFTEQLRAIQKVAKASSYRNQVAEGSDLTGKKIAWNRKFILIVNDETNISGPLEESVDEIWEVDPSLLD